MISASSRSVCAINEHEKEHKIENNAFGNCILHIGAHLIPIELFTVI
jgi:hypothetical protein